MALERGGAWEAVLDAGYKERGYDLLPVLLSEEEVKGFYEGFANGILWPLFHDLLGQCNFDPSFWYAYLQVNEKFADSVLHNSREGDFIWVQDYQLIHVAESIRHQDESARIGFFLHIPFPPLDILLRLPWRGQILRALLAYDLLGFQTPRDTRNFLTCIENLLPGWRSSTTAVRSPRCASARAWCGSGRSPSASISSPSTTPPAPRTWRAGWWSSGPAWAPPRSSSESTAWTTPRG